MILFVIFVIIPLIEITLFVQIGGIIGLVPTLSLCVVTAVAGAVLIRMQGLATLAAAMDSLNRGALPVEALFDGICIAAAGAMLLTPGFFTDAVGFCLLVPRCRTWLRHRLAAHFIPGQAGAEGGAERFDIIEAEYERLDEQDRP